MVAQKSLHRCSKRAIKPSHLEKEVTTINVSWEGLSCLPASPGIAAGRWMETFRYLSLFLSPLDLSTFFFSLNASFSVGCGAFVYLLLSRTLRFSRPSLSCIDWQLFVISNIFPGRLLCFIHIRQLCGTMRKAGMHLIGGSDSPPQQVCSASSNQWMERFVAGRWIWESWSQLRRACRAAEGAYMHSWMSGFVLALLSGRGLPVWSLGGLYWFIIHAARCCCCCHFSIPDVVRRRCTTQDNIPALLIWSCI